MFCCLFSVPSSSAAWRYSAQPEVVSRRALISSPMSNIGYGMDMLCSNSSSKVTEILKRSNRNFKTICVLSFPDKFLKLWKLIPRK